jgi:predicted kinase
MMEIIDSLIEARFNVIADASFLLHKHRQLLAALAKRRGVALVWIDASASNDELLRRLKFRKSVHDDASEAGPEILAYQYRHADPLTSAEREHAVFVRTDRKVDPGAIIKSIKSVL